MKMQAKKSNQIDCIRTYGSSQSIDIGVFCVEIAMVVRHHVGVDEVSLFVRVDLKNINVIFNICCNPEHEIWQTNLCHHDDSVTKRAQDV